MKKIAIILSVCILVSVLCMPGIYAYAGDDYLKVIEKISEQSGVFEQGTGGMSEFCNGLIYGEFIDFDNNGLEEMLLIYRDDDIVLRGWARAEIYAVVDGYLQCVFAEEVCEAITQSDIGYNVYINNIDGQQYFITNIQKPASSAACSEKIAAFTMAGGYPVRYDYYGEALDWWETGEITYTKCTINDRLVSAQEYKNTIDWLHYGARVVTLLNVSAEEWNHYYCTYDRLQQFMSRAYSLADEAVKVTINGDRVVFDVPPQIIGGRTMVPVRAIFETFGAAIAWDAETQTITAVKDGTTITMKIGAGEIKVDENVMLLDVPAQIIDGRTLVPARAVAQAFGCEVLWDGSTRTVIITTDEPIAFG